MAQGDHRLFFQAMNRQFAQSLSLGLLVFTLMGCEKPFPKKTQPQTTSKDFWIDRCEMTYRGKAFPITGTIQELTRLLGPHDRFDTTGLRHWYFWDDLGLKVNLVRHSKTLVSSIDLYFDREESSYEKGLRLGGRPEAKKELAEVNAIFPQHFFKGEVILEGAAIGPIIDFKQVDETRIAYMKTQTGPDARLKSAQGRPDIGFRPITGSYSPTTYYLQRFCADGQHRRFTFTLISENPPLRLESLTIGSDNVPDTVAVSGTPESSPLKHPIDPVGPK